MSGLRLIADFLEGRPGLSGCGRGGLANLKPGSFGEAIWIINWQTETAITPSLDDAVGPRS